MKQKNKTPEQGVFNDMLSRCRNPNSGSYHRYGGRGISVCPEWVSKGGFLKFIEHVGRRPTPLHSIDRVNNDGNYEPGNVRWATRKEQASNKAAQPRDYVRLSYQGLRILKFFMVDTKKPRSGSEISLSVEIKSGSLYPLLARFEDAGWMVSEWENIDPVKAARPRKRFYRLTALGKQKAKAALAEFR